MFRAWLIIVIAAGVFSSMLSTCGKMVSAPSGLQQASAPAGSGVSLVSANADAGDAAPSGGGLVLKRQFDGHFYADAQINGAIVRMLVDTGASGIALTRDDARRAGIGISIGMPNVVGQGAGGAVKGEYVTLERVSLGSANAEAMPAVVLDGGGQSLLGQSFLSRFASVEMRGDTMVLR